MNGGGNLRITKVCDADLHELEILVMYRALSHLRMGPKHPNNPNEKSMSGTVLSKQLKQRGFLQKTRKTSSKWVFFCAQYKWAEPSLNPRETCTKEVA